MELKVRARQQVRDTVVCFTVKLPRCLFWPEPLSGDGFPTFFLPDFRVSVFLEVEHTCAAPHGRAYAAPVCFLTALLRHRSLAPTTDAH